MDLPSAAELDAAADLNVLRADGTSVPFRSVYSAQCVARRVLVIFVRHFFCGNCQEYLRTITQDLTPETLLSLPIPTTMAVIGCGSPDLIPMYTSLTGCRFPIYADPRRALFDALGMRRTFSLGPRAPDYMRRSVLANSLHSVVQVLRSGATRAFKGGDIKQNGGELLFDAAQLVWAHRMQNTRDHAELVVLKRLLGVC